MCVSAPLAVLKQRFKANSSVGKFYNKIFTVDQGSDQCRQTGASFFEFVPCRKSFVHTREAFALTCLTCVHRCSFRDHQLLSFDKPRKRLAILVLRTKFKI